MNIERDYPYLKKNKNSSRNILLSQKKGIVKKN
jgi:hypothetical protein